MSKLVSKVAKIEFAKPIRNPYSGEPIVSFNHNGSKGLFDVFFEDGRFFFHYNNEKKNPDHIPFIVPETSCMSWLPLGQLISKGDAEIQQKPKTNTKKV